MDDEKSTPKRTEDLKTDYSSIRSQVRNVGQINWIRKLVLTGGVSYQIIDNSMINTI